MIIIYALEALFVAAFYLSLLAVALSPIYWVLIIRSQRATATQNARFKIPPRR